jgi:hypothetical protein
LSGGYAICSGIGVMGNNPSILGWHPSTDPFSVYDDPHQIHASDLFDRLAPSVAIKSRFSDRINERAWKLLEENFTQPQWEAFQAGKTVELHNKAKTHRLLLNRGGSFMVMKGDAGEGVTLESGAIREGSFPLGDEMKSFIEWFIERTDELLSRWGCSNYTIRPLSSYEEERSEAAEEPRPKPVPMIPPDWLDGPQRVRLIARAPEPLIEVLTAPLLMRVIREVADRLQGR